MARHTRSTSSGCSRGARPRPGRQLAQLLDARLGRWHAARLELEVLLIKGQNPSYTRESLGQRRARPIGAAKQDREQQQRTLLPRVREAGEGEGESFDRVAQPCQSTKVGSQAATYGDGSTTVGEAVGSETAPATAREQRVTSLAFAKAEFCEA